MIKKYKNSIFIFIALLILMAISFSGLQETFFQQDEWQYFGAYISALSSPNPLLSVILPYRGELTHFFPFGQLLFFMEFTLFGVNFPPYVNVGLFFHFINAVLVYMLVKKIISKKLIAFFTSALFLTNTISHQPVTWILAGLGTLPSTTFMLLSIIFFIDFLKKNNYKFFIISLLLFFISLLFKEIALFLFLFYPLIWLFFSKEREKFSGASIRPLFALIGMGVSYVLFRFTIIIYNIHGAQPEITDQSSASLISYVYRFFTVSFKGMPQSFIPQEILVKLANFVTHLAYPQFVATDGAVNPYIAQSIVFDLTCYFLSTIILFIMLAIFLYFKKNEKNTEKALSFSLLLILTSLFPFIFVAGKAGYYSIFEPRNLYVAMIGSSLALSIVCYFLACLMVRDVFRKKVITALLLLPFLLLNIVAIRSNILQLEVTGQLRKSFLQDIQGKYPSLPTSVVFYSESDRPYYGMSFEEKTLPVQSGFGRMLMIWYQAKEKYPSCFYEDQFLYGLLEQGYRECGNKGFGYFRQYAKLVNAISENKVPIDSIIGFSWNGKTKEFKDISQETKNKVAKDININK